MSINIVIPMAGAGSRFAKEGYLKPKPFIDVMGKPMIVRVMENLEYPDAKYILVAQKEHMEREKALIEQISSKYNAVFVPIDHQTEGAACTVLHARKYINNDEPLLMANSDQIVDFDLKAYIEDCVERGGDGSILTFRDITKNPKWSFAQISENGEVERVKEKEAISEYATVGLYFFSKGRFFVNSAIDMIVANDRSNNEFYTCPVYNYSIREGKRILIYNIPESNMHGIGTPADLNAFLEKNPLNY
ncbi:glycosyltransferase family 2 protein [Lentiprolixibacter aurantiacus]|uniref:Glycosyltransferase family 2 protein n=1 Tax=Lentiprolixibacter aurantiacus TaxID=2993939 RepID=A0AAE3SMG0_9FLAO|nr:glycosyltransferase family 2 protein [Lentiprolixibacter aurantiacus]MCX2718544.1 glycosyltransferase family 2 protein [Lentiprolixibacter aurantiacus]